MKEYDWKITAQKGLFITLEVILGGMMSYLLDNNVWLVIIPFIEMGRNYVKHNRIKLLDYA